MKENPSNGEVEMPKTQFLSDMNPSKPNAEEKATLAVATAVFVNDFEEKKEKVSPTAKSPSCVQKTFCSCSCPCICVYLLLFLLIIAIAFVGALLHYGELVEQDPPLNDVKAPTNTIDQTFEVEDLDAFLKTPNLHQNLQKDISEYLTVEKEYPANVDDLVMVVAVKGTNTNHESNLIEENYNAATDVPCDTDRCRPGECVERCVFLPGATPASNCGQRSSDVCATFKKKGRRLQSQEPNASIIKYRGRVILRFVFSGCGVQSKIGYWQALWFGTFAHDETNREEIYKCYRDLTDQLSKNGFIVPLKKDHECFSHGSNSWEQVQSFVKDHLKSSIYTPSTEACEHDLNVAFSDSVAKGEEDPSNGLFENPNGVKTSGLFQSGNYKGSPSVVTPASNRGTNYMIICVWPGFRDDSALCSATGAAIMKERNRDFRKSIQGAFLNDGTFQIAQLGQGKNKCHWFTGSVQGWKSTEQHLQCSMESDILEGVEKATKMANEYVKGCTYKTGSDARTSLYHEKNGGSPRCYIYTKNEKDLNTISIVKPYRLVQLESNAELYKAHNIYLQPPQMKDFENDCSSDKNETHYCGRKKKNGFTRAFHDICKRGITSDDTFTYNIQTEKMSYFETDSREKLFWQNINLELYFQGICNPFEP
eukprot:g2975.t1